MQLRFVTSHMNSESLKRLRSVLSKKVGYIVPLSYSLKPNSINIIYGDSKNKLYQYQWFTANQVPSLPFTTDLAKVSEWQAEGAKVVARTLLNSAEGKGIIVLQPDDGVVQAKVYTKYVPKKREYRVHIFGDKVVCVLEKRKKKGIDNKNFLIQNTANGFVFCRDNVVEPEGIRELALKARKLTNSSLVGVDIGFNEKYNYLFVIEVNTTPGFVGTTVEDYANAIYQAHSF